MEAVLGFLVCGALGFVIGVWVGVDSIKSNDANFHSLQKVIGQQTSHIDSGVRHITNILSSLEKVKKTIDARLSEMQERFDDAIEKEVQVEEAAQSKVKLLKEDWQKREDELRAWGEREQIDPQAVEEQIQHDKKEFLKKLRELGGSNG